MGPKLSAARLVESCPTISECSLDLYVHRRRSFSERAQRHHANPGTLRLLRLTSLRTSAGSPYLLPAEVHRPGIGPIRHTSHPVHL